MSLAAILVAARNVVQTGLNIEPKYCQVRIGPEPPAWCGQFYFAVWPSNWGPGPSQQQMYDAMDELFEFSVTLSYRAGFSPDDTRAEEILIKALSGMEPLLRSANQAITQQRYDIVSQANASSDGAYGIIEPPIWQRTDAQPQLVGPEWFGADPNSDGIGLHMTSQFGSIRRYQSSREIR